jgi:hypothetical protein
MYLRYILKYYSCSILTTLFSGWLRSIWERGGMKFLPIFGPLLRLPTGTLIAAYWISNSIFTLLNRHLTKILIKPLLSFIGAC